MAITGLVLLGFLIIHALGNSTIFGGRDLFLAYALHLHAMGPLPVIAQIFLAILFAMHIITGFTLYLQNRKARPIPYFTPGQCRSDLSSRTMPQSGLLILLFLGLHMFTLHGQKTDPDMAEILAVTLSTPLYIFLYLCGITALTLHLFHGLCSLFQSLGLTIKRRGSLPIMILIRMAGLWPMAVFFTVIILIMASSGNILR